MSAITQTRITNEKGHYMCITKNLRGEGWVQYNDNQPVVQRQRFINNLKVV